MVMTKDQTDQPRTEVSKVEASLEGRLSSALAFERRWTQNRILEMADREPWSVTIMLLRHYDCENDKARDNVRLLLSRISERDESQEAILDGLSHPSREVRKGAAICIPHIWGETARPYPILFEQTYSLLELARQRGLDVRDIETLLDLSKVSFLDGELVKAIGDVSVSLEFLRRRYQNSESLNNYLADMLKMAPDLEKIGLDNAQIEQSLLTAVKINRSRKYDMAQDLIDQRIMEVEIKERLRGLGNLINSSMRGRPVIEVGSLITSDMDMVVLTRKVIEGSTTNLLHNDIDAAVEEMHRFLYKDLDDYFDESVAFRLAQGERSASLTMYLVTILLLKMASSVMPFSAENIYQQTMKDIEGAPSIFLVIWPDLFMEMAPPTMMRSGIN
jgi:hypothetical protein